jgi:hypothetical protein
MFDEMMIWKEAVGEELRNYPGASLEISVRRAGVQVETRTKYIRNITLTWVGTKGIKNNVAWRLRAVVESVHC